MKASARDALIDDVRYGRRSPDGAEVEARRLGLEPLANEPAPSDFDPMKEPRWTLSMAAAWIAGRSPDTVRKWWDKYRTLCWIWRSQRWQVPGGPVYDGHILENPAAPTLALFRLFERADPRPDGDPKFS